MATKRSWGEVEFSELVKFRPSKWSMTICGLVFAGSMALAEEAAVISLCRSGDAQGLVTCNVYNPFERSIASLEYSLVAIEEGREVPWGSSSGTLSVAGGVEPGETAGLAFKAPELPERAKGREILIVVDRARAYDVSGRVLNPLQPSANISQLSDFEADRLISAIAPCWNVGALSMSALRATVVLSVQIDATGLPDARSIAFVDGSTGSETDKRQAFEAARRAVIRCGARGLPYGPEMEVPRTLMIEFAPDGIRAF